MAENKDYKDIVIEADELKDFDGEELHKELKAQLGDMFRGVSAVEGQKLIIHMSNDARGAEISKVRQIYAAHDVSKLPPKPVRKTIDERLAAMETEIAALKAQNAK